MLRVCKGAAPAVPAVVAGAPARSATNSAARTPIRTINRPAMQARRTRDQSIQKFAVQVQGFSNVRHNRSIMRCGG